ncbi:hypothetical protein ZWY2020_007784 [Hordeum vulgare]|nr:hypothetical protein ZWY2020_007784 [Hordeum vulgare]
MATLHRVAPRRIRGPSPSVTSPTSSPPPGAPSHRNRADFSCTPASPGLHVNADSSPHQGLFPLLGCMSLVRQLEIMYDHSPRPWSFPCLQQLLDPSLDDPACHPKPKATSHSRTGPPKKIEAEAKKRMKRSKGDSKMMAPAAPKDEEEHPSAAKGGPSVGPATKLELSGRKHITRTKTMKQLKKAT